MQVQCPSCSKAVDAPDDRAGQVISCPGCGGQMQLPAMSLQPAPAPAPPGAAAGAGEAAGESKACPYCGEAILKVAKKCKHCGSFVMGSPAPRGRPGSKFSPRERLKRRGSGDGRVALIFGLIGLIPICTMPIFAVLALIYGLGARKHEAERGVATAGMVLGIAELAFLVLLFVFGVVKGLSR